MIKVHQLIKEKFKAIGPKGTERDFEKMSYILCLETGIWFNAKDLRTAYERYWNNALSNKGRDLENLFQQDTGTEGACAERTLSQRHGRTMKRKCQNRRP